MAQPLGDGVKPNELHIQIDNKAGVVQFASGFSVFYVRENGERTAKLSTDLRNVIYAEVLEGNVVKIATLVRRKKALGLVFVEGKICDPDTVQTAETWVSALMSVAYNGVPPRRRLKVLVNPAGGKGRAVGLFEKKVKPILVAAHCEVDSIVTTHARHATELAQSLPLDYDALLTVSGDGLIFEVLNGFRTRPDAVKAFSIPICPIPTGSGNALAINLLGVEEGFDLRLAALNAIKGRKMAYDLCSLTQDGETSISFMSQAIGLMADLDLGTENLRWMGDTRFTVGFLKGVANRKPCAMSLSMKITHRDKTQMVQALQELKASAAATDAVAIEDSSSDVAALKMAPQFAEEDVNGPGWFTFDKPVLYVYAGTMPYVGRDMMAFPVSLPSDGLVDVSVQELIPRPLMLRMLSRAEKGEQFWLPSHHYFRAEAYRLQPHASSGHLSIDGERFPYKEFHVEPLKGLGTTLSMTGTWFFGDFSKGKGQPAVSKITQTP